MTRSALYALGRELAMRVIERHRSAVVALMAEFRFPKTTRIGSRSVQWIEQEVLDFIASRPRGGSERPA